MTDKQRAAWQDAPVAVQSSVFNDLNSMIDALPAKHFPLTKKELLLLIAGWRNDKGSM